MGVTSNLPEVANLIGSLNHLLDLNNAGRGGRLGDLMADVVAAGIQARTLDQQRGPGGDAIAANRGRYGSRKRSRGIKVGVGLYGEDVGGSMLEFSAIRGMVAISGDEVVMEYGLDAEDKDKADWFTSGNPATGQPPRPFYELDDDINDQLFALCAEFADSGLRDLGATG